jgi:hypothetical protein
MRIGFYAPHQAIYCHHLIGEYPAPEDLSHRNPSQRVFIGYNSHNGLGAVDTCVQCGAGVCLQ